MKKESFVPMIRRSEGTAIYIYNIQKLNWYNRNKANLVVTGNHLTSGLDRTFLYGHGTAFGVQ